MAGHMIDDTSLRSGRGEESRGEGEPGETIRQNAFSFIVLFGIVSCCHVMKFIYEFRVPRVKVVRRNGFRSQRPSDMVKFVFIRGPRKYDLVQGIIKQRVASHLQLPGYVIVAEISRPGWNFFRPF